MLGIKQPKWHAFCIGYDYCNKICKMHSTLAGRTMAKILLVDDDTNIHEIVSLFLENAGHSVTCVSSGLSGLDYATHNRVDLIILDLAMPVMDGIETFEKLRNVPKSSDVPIMILSVHDESELGTSILTKSHVSYVNKPVDMDRLLAAVEKALGA